jgi:peptidoglycan/LPS O-acetylase OafA/YrhL
VTRKIEYRPDLDGMRGIAVLLAVFYHADFGFVPGGFVGLEMFFVISGYLITAIVARELESDSFTFGKFYTRRIKRLLPAFYTVTFVTGVFACYVLLPHELEQFAESLLSSLFFVSNVYFGSVTEGYFAPESDFLPLLHTWSLSVEEQFYFLWPFSLLLLLRRRMSPRSRSILLGVVATTSFAAAEIGARALSDSVYYALWGRIGELLIGALLALYHLEAERGQNPSSVVDAQPSAASRLLEVGASAAAFAMIGVPAILLDDRSLYPGINAIAPCLGTAILIHVGRRKGALSRRILAFRPIVFVGLVSYALYLWHWPLFVFAHSLRIDFGPATASILLGVAFVLSTISWRFIENPIRRQFGMTFRYAALRVFAGPAIALAAACLVVISTRGLEARFQPEVLEALRIIRAGPDEERGICFRLNEVELPPEDECLLGARVDEAAGQGGGPDALLWGDSIANHYSGFLDEVGRASGLQIRDVTMGGCGPLLGTVRLERKKGPLCRKRNDAVMELIRSSDFDTVFIGGGWAFYLEPDGFLGDDVDMSMGRENSARVVRASLDRTVSAVLRANKQPVLLLNVPHMDFDASTCTIKNAIHPALTKQDCRMDTSQYHANVRQMDAILRDLKADHPALEILSVIDIVCPGESCLADLDGVPLYKAGNTSHLNMAGSRALGRAYLERHGPLSYGGAVTGADHSTSDTDTPRRD